MRKRRKKRLLRGFKANMFLGKDPEENSTPKKDIVKRTKPGSTFKIRRLRVAQ